MPPQRRQTEDAGQLSGPGEIWRATRRMIRAQRWMLLGLLLALVLAEGALRLVRPELAGLVYSADMTGGHPIVVTQEGYRVPADVPGQAPADAPILLGLGDSTTFGTGVGAGETWPLALQRDLADTVLARNAGAEGGEVREFAFGVSEVWNRPRPPAAVVLLVTANMISFTDFRWDNPARDPRRRILRLEAAAPAGLRQRVEGMVQSSALWKAVSLDVIYGKFAIGLNDHRVNPARPLSPLMAYGWVQPDMPEGPQPRMWGRFEEGLVALALAVEAQGSCLVLGYLPPRFMLSDSWRDNLKFVPKDRLTGDPEPRLMAMVEALDLPMVDTAGALRAARADLGPGVPLYIPGDYTHLDATGHEVVAAAMAVPLRALLDGSAPCRFGAGQ